MKVEAGAEPGSCPEPAVGRWPLGSDRLLPAEEGEAGARQLQPLERVHDAAREQLRRLGIPLD